MNKYFCIRNLSIVKALALVFLSMPVFSQQLKINSGAYLNSTGATIVVNGKVDNAGAISNSGAIGFNVSGNWINSGTFVAGAAIHKIGGNFTNNGTFTETSSTI